MPPSRALPSALKPLATQASLNHHPRPAFTKQTQTQRRARALSSAHSAESEHPSPHSDHYDPPSGWLFNVPPGEKYKKEGWENVWVYGFWGSIGLGVVAYAYKPDTS